jgi:hypothetical protein
MSKTFNNIRLVGTGSIEDTTASLSSNTGALTVIGGIGAAGDSYFGGTFNVETGSVSTFSDITPATNSTNGAVVISGGIGTAGDSYFGGAFNVEAGSTSTFSDITPATSSTNGAVVVSGGVGVAGDSYFGGALNVEEGGISSFSDTTAATSSTNGAVVVSGGVGVAGDSYFGGALNVENITPSTSSTTGSVVVAGGVGIGGDLHVGGDIKTNGSLITADSQQINLGDRYLFMNASNVNSSEEAGIIMNHSSTVSSANGNEVGAIINTITTGTPLLGLASGDLVQVHGTIDPKNSGIYEVDVVTTDQNFTVKSGGEAAFCISGSTFGTDNDTGAVVSKISVGIVKFEGNGDLAYASSGSSTFTWKYPVTSHAAAYEAVETSPNHAITASTTAYISGIDNDVKLPDNTGSAYNGNSFTVINVSGSVVTVKTLGGNIDDTISLELNDGDRAEFRGGNDQWYSF